MQDKTENFINKAKQIHGDKYDYSKVEYVNNHTKVCIICPKHGEFWQEPRHHLSKHGCPMCGKKTSDRKQSLTLNEFIEKSKQIHNGKYIYDKVNYVNLKTKVCIICPKHGEFWQAPHSHLRGQGCPKCRRAKNANSIKITNEIFIEKATQIHGGKYDYSKVEYINAHTKVCIVCPEHGEFWQRPDAHLKGSGCPKCKNTKIRNALMLSKKEFVNKANYIHHNKYDYSKVNYVNGITKVCIICPEHGEFWQLPTNHLRGKGCSQCNGGIKYDTETFIQKANIIHNNKYDYSQTRYVNSHCKMTIICKEHGIFEQRASAHLLGQGCPLCGNNKIIEKLRSNTEDFIEKANRVHNFKYDYSKSHYVDNRTKLSIICPIHGEFWQSPDSHLQGRGCPKCGNIMSNGETEIMELLKGLGCQQRNRGILKGKEIDIFIPSLKLGIEYNGLFWHSEDSGKDNNYHINKLIECNKQGIRLIQIFEDEWINHREICESKLKQICGLNTNPKIYGRKCEIHEITDKNEAYEFLDKNHIQGRTGFTVGLGAYYNSELVGVMTFKKEKEGYWDLNRFATDINHQCVGIGGKLFKYFTRNYKCQEIKSFADRRWTTDPDNNLYTKLGFAFDSFVPPSYWYYNPRISKIERFHKFGFRKQHLNKQYGLPLTMTEREMTESLGYTRIWDCGLIKYIYRS